MEENDIKRDAVNREHEIQFYCGHITSELEDFYTEEYEVLELLASGNTNDFNDLTQDKEMVRHLKSYGLVDFSTPFMPKFAIPVIQGYIANKWKKKNNQRSDRYVVPSSRRQEYVLGRLSSIIRELRICEKRFDQHRLPALYRGAGPAEAELLAAQRPVSSREELVNALNQCSRSLLEPIDETGKKKGRPRYFFEEIMSSYSLLWPALNRVRAYRNYMMHSNLNRLAESDVKDFMRDDLDGASPASIEDGWFRVQAAVLDGLVIGIQAELAKYV